MINSTSLYHSPISPLVFFKIMPASIKPKSSLSFSCNQNSTWDPQFLVLNGEGLDAKMVILSCELVAREGFLRIGLVSTFSVRLRVAEIFCLSRLFRFSAQQQFFVFFHFTSSICLEQMHLFVCDLLLLNHVFASPFELMQGNEIDMSIQSFNLYSFEQRHNSTK